MTTTLLAKPLTASPLADIRLDRLRAIAATMSAKEIYEFREFDAGEARLLAQENAARAVEAKEAEYGSERLSELREEARRLWRNERPNELEEARAEWFRNFTPWLFRAKHIRLDALATAAEERIAFEGASASGGRPARYAKALLTEFETPTTWHKNVRTGVEKFLSEWASGNRAHVGLLFFGPTGSGKTFLLSAIASYFERERMGYFWRDVSEWLDEIKGEFNERGANGEAFQEAALAPVLFLDDLGKERATDFARDAVQRLLDRRYRDLTPAFLTSNLSPGKSPYTTPGNELETSIGERLFSRLHSMVKFVGPFPAHDWRKSKGWAGAAAVAPPKKVNPAQDEIPF